MVTKLRHLVMVTWTPDLQEQLQVAVVRPAPVATAMVKGILRLARGALPA